MGKAKGDLVKALRYTRELLSMNEKVIFDVSAEPYPRFFESEIRGLEGVEINSDEENWLSIKRLRETQPPSYHQMFDGWVSTKTRASVDQAPVILSERMVKLSADEAQRLLAQGIIAGAADIMRPVEIDPARPDDVDVILRANHIPGFAAKWREYVDGPWARWVELERPRRRSIDFYNKLYQLHQRIVSLGDDNPIELVFGIGVARWKMPERRINAPILEQLVELELEEDGTIAVRPRNTRPLINLRPFHELDIDGSKALQGEVDRSFDRLLNDPDIDFSPFELGPFGSILRSCAARLSASGIYIPDVDEDKAADRTLPDVSEALVISDTWLIYVRQRNEDFRKDDIERLIRRIEDVEDESDLPRPGLQFVLEPSDEKLYDGTGLDLTGTTLVLPEGVGGWSGSGGATIGSGGGSGERKEEVFFFPLAFNDDQMEVIRRLEEKTTAGVLVQGPPGTGKTHTIANVICHFLATKRRVLVTAKTPEALSALQEKIPEGIRDLAISVIHNDRDGARQLERAVRMLANEAKAINISAVERQIFDLHNRLNDLRREISAVVSEIAVYARKNLDKVRHGESHFLPMDLARSVAEDRARFCWLEDNLTLEARHQPTFGDAEIFEISALRTQIGEYLNYQVGELPNVKEFPDLARVLGAHNELARIKEIDGRSASGDLPVMSFEVGQLEAVRRMHGWLGQFAHAITEATRDGWPVNAYLILVGAKQCDAAERKALSDALGHWVVLQSKGRDFLLKAVDTGDVEIEDREFDQAIAAMATGEEPFGWFSFFKGGIKARMQLVRIEGRPPSAPDEWKLVQNYREWRRDVSSFLGRWSAVSGVFGAAALPLDWQSAQGEFFRVGRVVDGIWRATSEVEQQRGVLKKLFPYGVDFDAVFLRGSCDRVLEALSANLEKAQLVDAHAVKKLLVDLAGGRDLPWHVAVQTIADSLGDRDVAQAALIEALQQIRDEAEYLSSLKDPILKLDRLVRQVAESGAPKWSWRLRNEIGDGVPGLAGDWRGAWDWARAAGFIGSLSDRDRIKSLTDRRAAAEAEQKKVFAEVVRLRTFLGLKQNLTARVEASLAKFAAAIAKLGKGTGKAASRHRRVIRESTFDTAPAVPCWILPEWRVAEQLPSELGMFDLVVIDEASQSDISALPVVLRGKKVLIVGDDKQVSPSVVGVEERKIIQLRTTYLTGLPFADQMDPATSLYELGGMVFPGKAIMLREHFRCVEPIIRFSSRFYPKPLMPLRIPKATERFNPPLVDIYVPYGRKVRDVNEAEAEVVVEEVCKLVRDSAFSNRSVGVISLIGDKQAKLIYDRLVAELGVEIIDQHKIMCGNAATFQGQERDVIFLSMVACKATATAQTSRIFEQRYNVAMSRARDRLVLVRSVSSSDLKPSDLKLAVI